MSEGLMSSPHVVKWGSVPYDLHDTLGRLQRSDFNYFFKDPEHGLVAGYWEAEDGHEDLGGDEFHEFLVVLDGHLYALPEGESEEIVAGPGDTVVVVAGRRMKLIVREPVKAFFVCHPMDDVEGYEAGVRKE